MGIEEHISGLIAEFRLNLTSRELHGLLRGIAAAPERSGPTRWPSLVTHDPSSKLVETLRELVHQIRGDSDLGLSPAPASRLEALRKQLQKIDLDGFCVPRGDAFHNEIPPRREDRLEWLTGFSGSAGFAVVLADRAAVFVDGRYTTQVEQEVNRDFFSLRHLEKSPPAEWLQEELHHGARLGFDPWLHTERELWPLRDAVRAKGAQLIAVERNPIDDIWSHQPAQPLAPLQVHPLAFAGRDSSAKGQEIAAELRRQGATALILSSIDSIAWLTNLRGGDVPHVPAFLAYAILKADASLTLFVDKRKLVDASVQQALDGIDVRPLEAFESALDELQDGRIWVDPSVTPAAVTTRLAGRPTISKPDPVLLAKAKKNDAELNGTRVAHRRDGAAMVRFLCWLDERLEGEPLGELEASARLLAFRQDNELFEDLSFETISGAGPNGAVIHYRPTLQSEKILEQGSLYLVDSGGQYRDGTTDITRTVPVGEPTAEHRDRFTRVLQGHIALAQAIFPEGTTGSQLDILARQALWEIGVDYDHGTGHGVGSYLSVHEGPQRIAAKPNSVALSPGMICSNEPGYYKPGDYGIRIENLVAVVPCRMTGAERSMLAFETLTLAPIDRRLIDLARLSQDECRWIDAYHLRVRRELSPLLAEKEAVWLEDATLPLSAGVERAGPDDI